MEIEAKFIIPDEKAYRQLKKIRQIQNFTIQSGCTQDIYDEYLDTADCRILQSGYACRFRRKKGKTTITLKSLDRSDGAIHHREELETNVESLTPPLHWPPSPVRRHILPLIGNQSLETLFSLEQQRHKRIIAHKKQKIAEFSLDSVKQQHKDASQSYQELEIELTGKGTEKELRHLIKQLPLEQNLIPQHISKFERGLAFANQSFNQSLITTPLTSSKAPPILPEDTITEAGYKALHFNFQKMLHNEPGTILGQDNEALHDMRVATRRMRAALIIFTPYLDKKALRPYTQWIKRTAHVLGRVRDMDVFYEKMQTYLQANDTPLHPVLGAWNNAYDEARIALLAYLSRRDYGWFKQQFAKHIQNFKSIRSISSEKIRPYRVKDIAPILIYQRLANVNAYAEWITRPDASLALYHQLRITTKYLRYTLEFFQNALPFEVIHIIQDIKDLQSHLGDLQDAIVACERLHTIQHTGSWDTDPRELATSQGNNSDIHKYYAYKQQEIQKLLATFPKLWQYYQSPKFKKNIATIISGL